MDDGAKFLAPFACRAICLSISRRIDVLSYIGRDACLELPDIGSARDPVFMTGLWFSIRNRSFGICPVTAR